MMTMRIQCVPPFALLLAALGAAAGLGGCAPVVIGAAATTAAVSANDRRTTGAQVDDESIELKVITDATARFGSDLHINVTSYNGIVLITGEAPSTVAQDEITALAKATSNVKSVHNEMAIGLPSGFATRSNDTLITSNVKTRFVENGSFNALHVKVVTERSVVYLMGIVTRQEADSAARIASTTSGVARVVKVFEYTD
jgi:osmotically-inducible protein OsmY